MVGSTISHYKITQKLGEGGMGVVYRAEDINLERPVALKFLAPHLLRDEDGRMRFQREAKAAAKLDHPNICTVHQIDQAEGRTFIAMAFLDGQPLSERIKEGPLKVSEALSIAIQMAEGLEAAHEKGIVHRDIKPDNVMLMKGSRGLVKLMDFGLAQLAGSSKFTREGTTLGTVNYMSPEQGEGVETDRRTDIWSLGVVLYEMVRGQKPFRGDFDQAIIYSIMNEPPEPLTAVRTGVPKELERIVNKCLAKKPEERYRCAEDLLVDLRNLRKSEESAKIAAPSAGTATPRRRKQLLPIAAAAVLSVAAVTWFARQGSEPTTPPVPTTDAPSVAIMPFINASGDPEFEYFSDGMTEELINALGKVRGLRVVGRTSVFRFKDRQYDSADVGERLQVGALLEGTVRKSGDRLRITAQLISTTDGFELWSDRYESEMKDVFDIQDEISRAMVGALSSELLGDSTGPIVSSATDNPEAYRLYLQGRRFYSSESGIRQRVKYLEEALELDPEYSQAHAALADQLVFLAILGYERPSDTMERAREEALIALRLDETSSDAHSILGHVLHVYDWDFVEAERSYRRALALNPASSIARARLAVLLGETGRFDESLKEVRLALQSDPLSVRPNLLLAYLSNFAGDFDAALRQATKALELEPRWNLANLHIAQAYLGLGRPEDALRVSELMTAEDPTNPVLLGVLGTSQAAAGRGAEARKTVTKLEGLRAEKYSPALPIAEVYIGLGDLDQAFRWLETAVAQREGLILQLRHFPVGYEPLKKDPRYDALLRRIGFPE